MRRVKIREDFYIGDGEFTVMAGPCSVESLEQVELIAKKLKENGIRILRGGAFKPRTNPESFQGLGYDGYKILNKIKEKYDLIIVSEVLDIRDIKEAIKYIDIIQVGTRNMYNYPLLKELGKLDKPILLKRGMSATIDEWINASKYITNEGNKKVIMCERGIRTFENYTRNTLDLMAIPIIKNETNLPIIVDPSHGTGRKELIKPAIMASKALNADGCILEIHPNPAQALSDGDQSLDLIEFTQILNEI